MLTRVEQINSLDDLYDYVNETLCEHYQLQIDAFPLTQRFLRRSGKPCGIYYCLHGSGFLMMETEQGDWAAEQFFPGRMLYAPPCWAHRSINTGTDDLTLFFAYPGHSGHDYGTIEQRGFRKLVIQRNGCVEVVDNPRWSPAVER